MKYIFDIKYFITILILILGVHVGQGLSDRLVTISSIKTRSLAMGGASVTMKDELAALDFNPAGFQTGQISQEIDFSIFFNLLGPIIMYQNKDNYSDWTVPFGWFVRGTSFSVGRIHLGILLNEEAVFDTVRLEKSSIFDATGYEGQRNTSFGLSFDLAPKVSLGIAGDIFIRDNIKKEIKLGHRYGVILKPRNNFSVGLCYINFPNDYPNDRLMLEGLADETLNIGVSYSPWPLMTLAIDVRNVSDEGQGADEEPRIGIELLPLQYIALRGGYFRSRISQGETFSLGVGLFNPSNRSVNEYQFLPFKVDVNATLIWQNEIYHINRWFLLSCVIGI